VKYYCCQIQRSENRIKNLAESSKEGYVSKRLVLPMTMMMIHPKRMRLAGDVTLNCKLEMR
jgi:ATP-dependent protease ClpP protease subunit